MRGVLLVGVFLGGCATSPKPASVVGPSKVVAPVPHPPNADEIVSAMQATFRNAKTYADSGRLETTLTGPRFGTVTVTTTFTTAFVRAPFTYRFEYDKARHGTETHVAWADLDHAYEAWSIDPCKTTDYGKNIDIVIGAMTGVSNGVAPRTAHLLFPDRLPGLRMFENGVVEGEEVIDGHSCWRLQIGRDGRLEHAWIDRTSHLLRRITSHHELPDGAVADNVVQYTPVLDGTIAATALAKPDLTNVETFVAPEPTWIGVEADKSGVITHVVSKSPAAYAKLAVGDHIDTVDSRALADGRMLVALVLRKKPGDLLHLGVTRADGTTARFEVTVAKRPESIELIRAELVGKPAPAFAATRLAGSESTKLVDHKGKVVIVVFCRPCSAMPALEELHGRLSTRGLDVLAITGGNHLAKNAVSYTVGLDDKDATIARAYFIAALPMFVVIDRTGIVRHIELAPDGLEPLVTKLL